MNKARGWRIASRRNKGILFIPPAAVFLALIIAVLTSPQAYALDENKCLVCHGNPDLEKAIASGEKISLYVNEKLANTGAHRYIDCTTCHATEPHKTDTPLTKLSLAQKCGTCHQYQYKLHLISVHGEQLAQGNRDVATCVDCHSTKSNPHSVIRVLEYSAPAYKKNISQTCASCHGNEELMASYGIVEKVYESYMRSFHGKAIQLGTYEISQLDKATCSNCHGTHDIKSASDPASSVAGLENLTATCQQCHKGAGEEFARGFLGHKEASLQNVPPVFVTEVVFSTIMKAVIGFAGFILVVAVVRFSVNRWRVKE